MGSTCDTVVRIVVGPTKSPICPFARPATPFTKDRTFVKSRFSCACSTCALAADTIACAASFA